MRFLRCMLIALLLVATVMASFVLFDDGNLPSSVSTGLLGLLCGMAGIFVEEKLFL